MVFPAAAFESREAEPCEPFDWLLVKGLNLGCHNKETN